MMNRILTCLIVVAMLVLFAACGSGEPAASEIEADVSSVSAEEPVQETQAVEEAETEERSEEPQSEQEELPVAEVVSSVDLAEVRDAMIAELEASDPFNLEVAALLNLYGISEDMVVQSGSFVTMAGTFPDEIIMVEAVDEAAAVLVLEKLQNRLNEVLVQSETYDADNYAAAQKCQVRCNGLYISLILSPKQETLAAIYDTFVS